MKEKLKPLLQRDPERPAPSSLQDKPSPPLSLLDLCSSLGQDYTAKPGKEHRTQHWKGLRRSEVCRHLGFLNYPLESLELQQDWGKGVPRAWPWEVTAKFEISQTLSLLRISMGEGGCEGGWRRWGHSFLYSSPERGLNYCVHRGGGGGRCATESPLFRYSISPAWGSMIL